MGCTCDIVASPLEDESSDRRMVTDLFCISRTSVDPALESFTESEASIIDRKIDASLIAILLALSFEFFYFFLMS